MDIFWSKLENEYIQQKKLNEVLEQCSCQDKLLFMQFHAQRSKPADTQKRDQVSAE